jgi:Smg protein
MFDVLVYVYENYWRGDACPEIQHLGRKLSAAGFEAEEIDQALQWLEGLQQASHDTQFIDISPAPASLAHSPSAHSMRVYSVVEQDRLGAQCLGFLSFLESAGVLPAHLREIVLDRAMAVTQHPVSLDDLKIIVLMAYWSAGIEPDALILDELCDDSDRVAH